MEKIFIKNRKCKKLSVVVDAINNPKGLVFVMHGLGGFKEQEFLQVYACAFKEFGFTVVMFDVANTIGESEGCTEDATMTNYYEDLEDVINWAKDKSWYSEPFWLAGHSLGSFCIVYYAENHPQKVKALAPTSAVISGDLMLKTWPKEEIENWQKTGWLILQSFSRPGKIKKFKWDLMKDSLQYNLLDNTDKLSMPLLLMVGENDSTTPLEHQKILFDKLSCKKEINIIKGAKHTFREPEHLKEIKEIFMRWIKENQ